MGKWRDAVFPTLVAFCALAVSGSAAFYSVTGLSKLFAGASFQVLIMASSLEISKLVIASLLYRYWSELNKVLKYYLTVAAGILVIITSMGIYGFLSSAYQETASIYQITSTETAFLQEKQKLYQEDLSRYDDQLDRISLTMSELSKAKAREIQIADTNAIGGFRTTVSTSELRLAESRLRTEEANRAEILERRDEAADSLRSIQTRILELKVANSTMSELGPLIYISNLSGMEMDKIVNILLLAIIFVFDPLAISLVIAANFVHLKTQNKQELELFKVQEEEKNPVEEKSFLKETTPSFVLTTPEFSKEEPEFPEVTSHSQQEEESEVEEDIKKEETVVTTEPEETSSQYETSISPIVKILQKTPSFIHVLRSNGKRDKLTKEQYREQTQN